MKKTILAIFVVASFVLMAGLAFAVNGASSVVEGDSSSMVGGVAQSNSALAGNVTELTIISDSSTQTWQGYYGNVSGAIQLANAAGDVMYNWSASNPSGEVLASINQTVDWASLACASAPNMLALETEFNADGVDGVNETFIGTGTETTIAGNTLTSCKSINVYNDTASSGSNFEELILWDGDAAVFASILEQDALGFDSKSHDFEMLVLEDGQGNTATTPYYFFVELN